MEIESRLLSLLSALEANGVNNCKIEIENLDCASQEVEVSALDLFSGSKFDGTCIGGGNTRSRGKEALDQHGNSGKNVAPYLNEPVHVWKNDSFIAAFPSPKVHMTCGIDFPKVCNHIG
ncbi:hypothetical protein Pint_22400 [Pistacia integerrima]|uniref:Uncharacterized protein n=1 Tax=Pistacia integerrima TaxID=434235 RepID=A0ACC0YLS4_9ROSI|nr:hypothetical protein Pint_22400 [Pistacia integerrima]